MLTLLQRELNCAIRANGWIEMRHTRLAIAALSMVGGWEVSAKALADTVISINSAHEICKDVFPPMPPEVARKAEREQWKIARKRGK